MKILPRKLRGILDYLVVALLIVVAPWLLGLAARKGSTRRRWIRARPVQVTQKHAAAVMDSCISVRKVVADYCGADGLPKPMGWAVAARSGWRPRDYEERVRATFREKFPEWRLRSCAAETADEDCATDGFVKIGVEGIWILAGKER
jgi:hypothetical protein